MNQIDGRRIKKMAVLFIAILVVFTQCAKVSEFVYTRKKEAEKEIPANEKMPSRKDVHMDVEIGIIRKMPRQTLELLASSGRPDRHGMVGRNRETWIHVSFQRNAMLYLIVSAERGDRRRTEEAWQAIEAAFSRQTESGNFEIGSYRGKRPAREDDLSGMAFWTAQLSHALLVLQQTEFASAYRPRIQGLLPKMEKMVQWLYQGREELYRYDSKSPNRLFFDAMAFGLSGILLDNQTYKTLGSKFAEEGLKFLRQDGVFVEKGGHDSSYQAVALLRLQQYALYFPDDRYTSAIARAAAWELGRIKENGEVDVTGNTRTGGGQEELMGRTKEVNYGEVILSLLYYGAVTGDERAIAAADRALRYARSL